MYSHTTNNVLSVTISWKLLERGSRFSFSHETISIPLKHLLQWLNGDENLEFKLRKTKNSDGEYSHVQDMYINNMIYRPTELEHFSCYDMVSNYELKKLSKKKLIQTATLWKAKKHSI